MNLLKYQQEMTLKGRVLMYRIVEKQKIAEAIGPETKCSTNY